MREQLISKLLLFGKNLSSLFWVENEAQECVDLGRDGREREREKEEGEGEESKKEEEEEKEEEEKEIWFFI